MTNTNTAQTDAELPPSIFEAALRDTAAMAILTDTDGTILYVNPAFERFYGYSKAEAVGQTPRIIKSGEHHLAFYKEMWRTITGGESWRGILINRCRNQCLAHVSAFISPVFDSSGQIRYFLGIQYDISERVQRDRDERDVILGISQAMRNAYTREQLVKIIVTQVCDLLGMDAVAIGLRQDLEEEQFPENIQMKIIGASGEFAAWGQKEFTVPPKSITASVLHTGVMHLVPNLEQDDRITVSREFFGKAKTLACFPLTVENRQIGVLYVGNIAQLGARDINTLTAITAMAANALYRQTLHENLEAQMEALKTAQEQIIHTEKLAAMGTLVAGIAHELNNPLTSILLYTQMALQQVEDARLRHDLTTIEQLTFRMSKVIRGMLDFAHPDMGNKTWVALPRAIDNVLTLLAHELRLRNIDLNLNFSPDLPPVYINESQLQQVFVNLLMNAMQATGGSKKQPRISIQAFTDTRRYDPQQSCVHMVFQNNGPHIPDAVLPHIFDPFFTTKRRGEGTGLGLSISHSIIKSHGGQIWAENCEGPTGVRFHIQLPIIDLKQDLGPLPASQQASPGDGDHQQAARILLIDDEPSILEVFARILQKQGYDVETASNSKDALSLIQKKSYDLVLCDIQMPDMSGLELYHTLKETHPEILPRIVFISGDSVDEHTQQFIHSAPNLLLNKPLGVSDLLDVVAQTLQANTEPQKQQR